VNFTVDYELLLHDEDKLEAIFTDLQQDVTGFVLFPIVEMCYAVLTNGTILTVYENVTRINQMSYFKHFNISKPVSEWMRNYDVSVGALCFSLKTSIQELLLENMGKCTCICERKYIETTVDNF